MKVAPSTDKRLTGREIAQLLGLFAIWRIVLFVIGSVAGRFLPYQPSFPYYNSLLPFFGVPQWLYSWANFDGVHYLTIMMKGYFGTGLIQAFFPGYPVLGMLVDQVLQNALISALVVSNLMAGVFIVIWFWWLKTDFSSQIAWRGVWILLLFPTSFFLGATYGESLFLTTVAMAFLAARWRWWWLAALMTLMASATRVVGIMLVPALLIELYQQKWEAAPEDRRRPGPIIREFFQNEIGRVVLILGGSLGLLSYMAYLDRVFHDSLYFLHLQSEFGAGRQESIVVYPQVVWRYIKILWTYQPHDWKYFSLIHEAVAGVVGLGMILLSIKKVRWSYSFFSVAVFLVPTLTGTFSSMPRYILPCIGIWMLLAISFNRAKPWVFNSYLVCSGVLLVINVILFIQGYWVA